MELNGVLTILQPKQHWRIVWPILIIPNVCMEHPIKVPIILPCLVILQKQLCEGLPHQPQQMLLN